MPNPKLSRGTLVYWRRLISTGVQLRDDLLVEPPGLTIEQVDGVYDSQIFTLPNGVVGYIVWLRLVSTQPGIMIRRWGLKPPELDPRLSLLPDPLGAVPYDLYMFPCGGPEFPRTDVLNHQVDQPLKGLIKGALLATGRKPIPEQYPHGSSMKMEVSAIDLQDQRYSKEVQLWVSRDTEIQSKPSRKPARTSLFDRGVVPEWATVPSADSPAAPSPEDHRRTLLQRDSRSIRRRVAVTLKGGPKLTEDESDQMA